jgi:hypothetical protein
MASDNPAKVNVDVLRSALIKMGRPPPDFEQMKSRLEKVGFEDVVALKAKEPVGPWPKDPILQRLGAMVLLHSQAAFESYGMAAFTRILEMDVGEAQGVCDAATKAARNKNYHIYSYQ